MAFFFVLVYFLSINGLTFIIYGLDKFFSHKHYYRISEKLLYLFSVLGGSLGAFLGMFFFKHKTSKLKFYLVNILTLLVWIGVTLWK